jgi:hypothetical protein
MKGKSILLRVEDDRHLKKDDPFIFLKGEKCLTMNDQELNLRLSVLTLGHAQRSSIFIAAQQLRLLDSILAIEAEVMQALSSSRSYPTPTSTDSFST